MNTPKRRVAISIADGYVPGLSSVIAGAVLAAKQLGWKVVGIHDGFDGLLNPAHYPDGGLVAFTPQMVEHLSHSTSAILGTTARTDPFRARAVNSDNAVEELDRSDELLAAIEAQKIDAVIGIAGPPGLSMLFKLHRKGLKVVCVPKSAENDMAATLLSFGFNSSLSFTTDMLDRARQAAESAGRIAVVEVLGEHAGWLALQAGMAVCADAVLIPEIAYDLIKVAAKLRERPGYGLVVVAEGAMPMTTSQTETAVKMTPLRASLSPGSTGHEGSHVIDRSGHVAQTVALELQRLTDRQTYPLVLGQLVKGGAPTAIDRQLGLGFGAGAIRALDENKTGVMIAFQPPDLKFVPLAEAINLVRTVPPDSVFVQTARTLGICMGDEA